MHLALSARRYELEGFREDILEFSGLLPGQSLECALRLG